MGRRSSRRRRRRTFRRRRKSPETLFWVILILVVAMTGAGFWVHNTLLASDRPVAEPVEAEAEVIPLAADPDAPPDRVWTPKIPDTHTSILLLGLDNFGMCDVVMIISYDMETYETSLISIMRDTFISDQTWGEQETGHDHLSWAGHMGMEHEEDYDGGSRLAALTVEDLLGIDIHAYAAVSFDGFVDLIDLIGGVTLEVHPGFAQRADGPLPTGWQRLDGAQALAFARHRQNPRIEEPGSSSQAEDRVIRNQNLMKATLEQCRTIGSEELMLVVEELDESLYTSLDDWDIMALANIFVNRDPGEIRSVVLPGEGRMEYQEKIDSEVYYYHLDRAGTDEILQELGLK